LEDADWAWADDKAQAIPAEAKASASRVFKGVSSGMKYDLKGLGALSNLAQCERGILLRG
jgi:hypothetical protein